MDREELKNILREILQESTCPIKKINVPQVRVTENDRLDTGDPVHRVYTHDLFSLQESPRLGCGVMEMEKTTFPWTLQYDEIDYVISGNLSICCGNTTVTAGPGNLFSSQRAAVFNSLFPTGRDFYMSRILPTGRIKHEVSEGAFPQDRMMSCGIAPKAHPMFDVGHYLLFFF